MQLQMISDHREDGLIKGFLPASLIQPAEEEVTAMASQLKGNLCLPQLESL